MRAELNEQYLKENKIYDKVKSLFSNKYGLDVIDIQPLGQGAGSIVLKVNTSEKNFAIKICMYPERSKKVIGEFAVRKNLINLGLDFVPRPLWIDKEIFNHGAVVFNYIEGNSPDFSNEDNLRKLAQVLSKLHKHYLKIIPDGYQVFQDHFKYLKDLVFKITTKYDYIVNDDIKHGLELALSSLVTILESKRNQFTYGLIGLCHDDVASNCITDPNEKIWLVDWENTCIEDIVEEIVYTAFGLDLNEATKSFFFDAYQKAFPKAKGINFLEVGKIYLELEPLLNICWGFDFLAVNLKRNLQPKFFINE
ncbi:MAG: phosphotransferase, partial [Promethearchaeota archaeon]